MEIKLLSLLSNEEKKLIKIKSFSNKEILYFEGSNCDEVTILVSGEIRIVSNFEDGRSIVYRVVKPGEIFANNLVFSSNKTYKGNVVANKDVVVAIISSSNLIKLLKSNEKFLIEYLRVQSDFGKELNGIIKVLTSSNSEEKIINYLTIHGGKVFVKSVTNLAEELNMSRENLSRCLTKMIKKKKIAKENKVYYLN